MSSSAAPAGQSQEGEQKATKKAKSAKPKASSKKSPPAALKEATAHVGEPGEEVKKKKKKAKTCKEKAAPDATVGTSLADELAAAEGQSLEAYPAGDTSLPTPSEDRSASPRPKKQWGASKAAEPAAASLAEEDVGRPVEETQKEEEDAHGTEVILHIYDVGQCSAMKFMNQVLSAVGTGAFHAGIEVMGKEWSFGYCQEGTGVFCCEPAQCQAHRYREAVPLGKTTKTEEEVNSELEQLRTYWPGNGYDLLRRNCCTFCDTLSRMLGCRGIPDWVKNLAGAAATVNDRVKSAHEQATSAAVIAAAKAGEVDEKYQVSGSARAKAASALKKGKLIDQHYKVSDGAATTANAAKEHGTGFIASVKGIFSKPGRRTHHKGSHRDGSVRSDGPEGAPAKAGGAHEEAPTAPQTGGA